VAQDLSFEEPFASLYEKLLGLDKLLPIDPKPGTVPPSS